MTVRLALARRCIVSILMLLAPLSPAGADAGPLRVMTFNVRLPLEQDGANAWERRRDLLADVVAAAGPDIIATQELYRRQGDYLLARMPGYAWFGIDRRGGRDDEHMGIFYRRDRLRLVDLGNFWLSRTPALPGSISWGHPYPRMVTWGLFEDAAAGGRFYVLNTHLPHRAEDRDARLEAAKLILERIAALPAAVPVVLAGDFNATPDSPLHALLATALIDARAVAPAGGPDGTYHGFTGKAERRIDWILLRGFEPLSVRAIATSRHGRYPSDHFPVIAELRRAAK